jgi:predicted enzyme related to lactoylglutathione lyase
MEKVLGIGGVFFQARDPKALADWYSTNLGLPIEPGQTYGKCVSAGAGEITVWSVFPAKPDPADAAPFKINYRVRDIDAMLAQLKAAGSTTSEKVDDYGAMGKFGWATDPEGNRFELWQPGN